MSDYPAKVKETALPEPIQNTILEFYRSFKTAAPEASEEALEQFLAAVSEQVKTPFAFEPYHRQEDFYYRMGLEFFRPLVIFEESQVIGDFDLVEKQLAKGENAIFLSNHQAEPDPQVISLLLEKSHPKLAQEMIFVAGHRVVTDPLTAPFSRGRNLLCIYSKRYIEHPPEQKQEKLLHNQKTMKRMAELLAEGGKAIYVAPSGGRDRPGPDGLPEVAPFDPQSIEMFYLMARQAKKPTHFYPLSLVSYNLLPPPHTVQKELGEKRTTKKTPVHLALSAEVEMENYPGQDKHEKRQNRATYIQNQVENAYKDLIRNAP